jgi:hypothetical protein
VVLLDWFLDFELGDSCVDSGGLKLTSRVTMGKSGVPNFWAAILLALDVIGLVNCGVSKALEIGMKALDESLELDNLRIGVAKDILGQLAQGEAVFIQAYGQKAGQCTVCTEVGM